MKTCPNCKYKGPMDPVDGYLLKCPKCKIIYNEDDVCPKCGSQNLILDSDGGCNCKDCHYTIY